MSAAIKLTRTYHDDATLGTLTVGDLRLYTLERPWRDNATHISCIPEGTYTAVWSRSPRLKKWTYEIRNVAARSGIRIHAGNVVDDSLGCPLLGMWPGVLAGKTAVLASREAVARFNSFGQGKPLTIEIKSAQPRQF